MTTVKPLARPFPLGAVRVDGASAFARARDELLHLARVYPVDRLLAVFRRNAGLATGAEPPGNWEGFGHPNEEAWGERDYPGRERAQTANLLRGHYAGHFLSMLAMAAAGEDDPALESKVDEFVAGLGEVQAALAATGRYSHPGFLAAYGEWQFSRLEHFAPYGEIWAPYYTCHKIMAGLLDARELTGSAQALDIATAMGHWVHGRLSRLEPERRQQMWSLYIAGEFGGMNETLARLATAAGEPLFLETASFFDQERLLDAGAARTDVLTDMHANQHLPQLIGYVEQYERTGARRYLDAAAGLWDQIVPGRTYAHGGTGESELWGPPATVAGDIGHRNAETCASYNLLKLARKLFAHTLEARYMDYYERTVLNHVLGSRRAVRSDTSPEVTYMFPVHPGALREYDNVGTCCGGTGLENHLKYQDTVFFESADGLWANLPVDAELHWAAAGLRVTQRSGFPLGEAVSLRFAELGDDAHGGAAPAGRERTVRLRVPAWAAGDLELRLNGGPTGIDPVPGEYVSLTRAWRAGDELLLTAPVSLRAEPAVDDPRLCALFLGPTLLLARSEATTGLAFGLNGRRGFDGGLITGRTGTELLAELAREGTVELDGVRFEPCWSGADTRYHMYVRSHDAEIAFGGVGTGVPNRVRSDGGTFLDELWEPGAFGDREAFLDRVAAVAARVRAEGLLGRDELAAVLAGAAAFDGAAAAGPVPERAERADRRVLVVEPGAPLAPLLTAHGLTAHGLAADAAPEAAPAHGRLEFAAASDAGAVAVTAWALPADDGRVPPAVAIEILEAPAPSGWFTTAPTVRLRGFDVDGTGIEESGPVGTGAVETGAVQTDDGLRLELRVSGGEWAPYTAPVVIEAQGVQRIEARVHDADGRTGATGREIAVDTAPPVSRATVKDLGSSVEITLHADDGVSGVERIQWEGPGTFWGTFQEAFVRAIDEGPQVIEYAATDRAGNEEPRRRLVIPGRDGSR
ncbi:glycoside hydrolase family 127 protein [Glycomyces sp. A-F 0318]|uniref:beta-L-arabinofuranosidase domain-containing protein n=1 Tax=Glycomyces amatae TaxID=2881355 RepID=UPI001E4C5EE5|nr:beta-L-arabinofuranosidase domain-containing protein [Glycomyces amatae]MCD0443940.1 glycoside hydrolase family 127 protein [Glycomyces amatae]